MEQEITYVDAVISLAPDKYSMVNGEGKVTWKDGATDVPTESEIQAELTRLKTEYASQAYARTRKSLYPDIGDQLDDLYKEGAFSASMAAKLKKVKDDNPKG